MRLTLVAFDENVFRLNDALLGRHRFDLFTFFTKPGHGSVSSGEKAFAICWYGESLAHKRLRLKEAGRKSLPLLVPNLFLLAIFQNSMPCCARMPALKGCLISFISVTRSAAAISAGGASRPVTTMCRAGCEARMLCSSASTSASGSR